MKKEDLKWWVTWILDLILRIFSKHIPDRPGPSRIQVDPLAELPGDPPLAELVVVESSPLEHIETALSITGSFEGTGYTQVTGDFDRQGISLGILQWNVGQGSLQAQILKPFRDAHGVDELTRGFPSPSAILSITDGSVREGLRVVRSVMLNGTRVKPDWARYWKAFLDSPKCRAIQMKACYGVAVKAKNLASAWNMEHSARAFCFFFDVVTQNGSMKGLRPQGVSIDAALEMAKKADRKNRAIWEKMIPLATVEQLTLFRAAHDRAQLSNPKYFQDVFARKGTIALGRGYVHGEDWTITFDPPATPRA